MGDVENSGLAVRSWFTYIDSNTTVTSGYKWPLIVSTTTSIMNGNVIIIYIYVPVYTASVGTGGFVEGFTKRRVGGAVPCWMPYGKAIDWTLAPDVPISRRCKDVTVENWPSEAEGREEGAELVSQASECSHDRLRSQLPAATCSYPSERHRVLVSGTGTSDRRAKH